MSSAETAAADAPAAIPPAEKQAVAAGPLKLPIPFPTPTSIPHERPQLTEAQQAKYKWLLDQVKAWITIETKDKAKAGPLTDDERLWLTHECLLRYLRATKWHEKEALKRLHDTVAWRRDYGVETQLTADYISPENETGKQIILGYDKQGRVCQYLNPGRQNTDVSPRQVQHLVYMVERVIDLLPPGQETLALLINFKQSKNRSNTAPGISTGREVLHILQTHYPERLGRALIVNVPWVVWGFFKLITPFIDPLTREKLKFNEDMNQYVPSEQLWTEFNGQLEFDYDHDVYWPALTKLAAERRAARKARWEAGGKQIGELEDYLSGKLEHGVAGSPEEAEKSAAAKPMDEETAKAASVVPATTAEKEAVEQEPAEKEPSEKAASGEPAAAAAAATEEGATVIEGTSAAPVEAANPESLKLAELKVTANETEPAREEAEPAAAKADA